MQTQAVDPSGAAVATATELVDAAMASNTLAQVVAEGRIDPQGDQDWFTVELVAGQWYDLDLVVQASVGLDPATQDYAYAFVDVMDPRSEGCVRSERVDLISEWNNWSQPFRAESTGPHQLRVSANSSDQAFGYDYQLRLAAVVEPQHTISSFWWPDVPAQLDPAVPVLALGQWVEGRVGGEPDGLSEIDTYPVARVDGQRLQVQVQFHAHDANERYLQLGVQSVDYGPGGASPWWSAFGIGPGDYSWILEPDVSAASTLTFFKVAGDSDKPLEYRLLVQAMVADDFPESAPGVLYDGLLQAFRVEPEDKDVFNIDAKAGELWLIATTPLQPAGASVWVRSEHYGASEVIRGGWSYVDGSAWQLVQVDADTQLMVNVFGYQPFASEALANEATPTHTVLAQRIELNLDERLPQNWTMAEPHQGEVNALMGCERVLVDLQAHQRYALDVQGGAVDISLRAAANPTDGSDGPSGLESAELKWIHHSQTQDADLRPSYISVEASGWYVLEISSDDKGDPFLLVPYQLAMTAVPMDDHGDTTATATKAWQWQTHFARLEPSDVDVFALDLQAGQRYAARLVGDMPWGYAWASLADAEGRYADLYASLGPSMVDVPFVVPTSGRYYLRLAANADSAVTFAYLPVDNDDHGDAWFNATPLSLLMPLMDATNTLAVAAAAAHAAAAGAETEQTDDRPVSQFTMGLSGLRDASSDLLLEALGP